ncbi:MAG: sigma-70 family RNA polymerase sigma factor [Kordiimonadaceae bacterium]|nr:sigma-70 family RNA polymerase sigma factor [Kordiimonadaceae bacterium]
MARTLEQIMEVRSAESKARIAARVEELELEHATLVMLRRAVGLTQKQLAETLGVGQDVVSKTEKRADMMLSTLRNFVSATGGTLRMVAEFPDSKPIEIEMFSDLKMPDEEDYVAKAG